MTTTTKTLARTTPVPKLRWPLRILLGMLGFIALLLIGGMSYQAIAGALDTRIHPAPGDLVDAGGHRLHLHVMGAEHTDGPTVILEAGATGFSTQWAWIQPEIAKTARVVAYDRAGAGWSETSGEEPIGDLVAEQLHTALQTAEIKGPYILVGHSFGGVLVRVFADRYPDEVSGMVLLDPGGPELLSLLTDEDLAAAQGVAETLNSATILARLGILRFYNPLAESAAGLPEDVLAATKALTANPGYIQTAGADLRQSQFPASETNQQARSASLPRPDLPIVVINRTEPPDAITQAHHDAGAAILTQTSQGKQLWVDGADHFSLVMNPVHAQVAVEEILGMITASGR